MEPSPLLALARSYLAAGLSLLPIGGDKHPCWQLLPRERDGTGKEKYVWKPLQVSKPTDADLQTWFGGQRPAGIGVICGKVSGHLETLDFDERAGEVFPEWLDLVEAEQPGLTARLCVVQTPSEGYHVRYRCPGEVIPGNLDLALDPTLPGKRKVLIETRGEGGYALAPGGPLFCHESGKPYLHVSGPPLTALPDLSEAERECLLRCARFFDRLPAEEDTAPQRFRTTPGPAGENLLPGKDFDRRGWDWDEILTPYGWVCVRTRGEVRFWRRPDKTGPCWSATTGHCKAQDGSDLFYPFTSSAHPFQMNKGYGKFRTFALLMHGGNLSQAASDLRRNHGFGKGSPSRQGTAGGREGLPHLPAAAGQRPPPRPPGQPPPPLGPYEPFPNQALPAPLAAFVDETACAIGCDQAFVALPVLAVVAAAIGATRQIHVKDDWYEPCIFWTAVVAPTGTHKTPAYLAAIAPLVKIQKEHVSEFGRDFADWNASKKEDKTSPPLRKQILVDDTTIEGLKAVLADNPRGVLLAKEELRGWFSSFTRYRGNRASSDISDWLPMHRGSHMISNRVTGDKRFLFVPRAFVSITGGIQPRILALAMTQEFLDAGLGARMLMAMPPRRPKVWTDLEVHPDTKARYETLLRALSRITSPKDESGQSTPHTLHLSREAKAVWVAFYNEFGQVQWTADEELAGAYAKLEAFALRFALLHHVVGHQGGQETDLRPIGEHSMRMGVLLCRWFISEVHRIYSMLGESDAERECRRLLEMLRHRGGEITPKKLHLSNKRRYPNVLAAEEALADLVKAGLGEWRTRGPGPRGGRPSKVFCLRAYETYETSPEEDAEETAESTTTYETSRGDKNSPAIKEPPNSPNA